MASTSKLELRVTSLFDRACSRIPVSNRLARCLIGIMLLFVVGLATVRIGHAVGNFSDKKGPSIGFIEEICVDGVVVDSNGKPIADANVALVFTKTWRDGYIQDHETVASTKTNIRGRFELSVPSPVMPMLGDRKIFEGGLKIAATKKELIPDWKTVYHWYYGLNHSGIELKLESDCLPISGRLIDPEGNPLADVTVTSISVSKPRPEADLDKWVQKALHNPAPNNRIGMLPTPNVASRKTHFFPFDEIIQTNGFPVLHKTARTNQNGEFSIDGIGRNRLVLLEFAKEGISKTRVNAVSRSQKAVPYPTLDPREQPKICFGNKFEVAIQPAQVIAGIIRDMDTKKPIAGVKVRALTFGPGRMIVRGIAESVTDKEGRYELKGIPRPGVDAPPTLLEFVPKGIPYFARSHVKVPKNDDLQPVKFDFALKKRVWATGQLVDSETGKPITGRLSYHPKADNEHVEDRLKDFYIDVIGATATSPWRTDDNGNFRIPVLPGAGVIAAIANEPHRFEAAYCEDKLELPRGLQDAAAFEFYQLSTADFSNAIKLVNIPESGQASAVTIRLKPRIGKTIKLRDNNGNAVSGVKAVGTYSRTFLTPQMPLDAFLAKSTCTISFYDLAESGPRLVVFHQPAKNIGKAVVLEKDGPNEVILEPCDTVRGKIIGLTDDVERPVLVAIHVPKESNPKGRNDWYHGTLPIASTTIGPDGSFEINCVIPGVNYFLTVGKNAIEIPLERKNVTDLGEVEFAPRKGKSSDSASEK